MPIDSQLLQIIQNNDEILSVVSLCNSQIDDKDAKALAEALKQNENLGIIDLSMNQISDEGAKALAEALKKYNAPAVISLRNNHIGDEGAKALAESLKQNKTQINIDLRDNLIGNEGAKALADPMIQDRIEFMPTSTLRQNLTLGLLLAIAAFIAYKIVDRYYSSGTTINLENQDIDDEALEKILRDKWWQFFYRNVTNINLARNKIGNRGFFSFLDKLSYHKPNILGSINFKHNLITDNSVASNLEIVRKLGGKHLLVDPDENGEFAKSFFQGTSFNDTVIFVELYGNKISNEKTEVLFWTKALDMLLKNNKLNLRAKNINDDKAIGLINTLKEYSYPYRLAEIDLIENKIGDRGAKALADILFPYATPAIIHLEGNNISDEGSKALSWAIKKNHNHLPLLYSEHKEFADFLLNNPRYKFSILLKLIYLEANKISDKVRSELNKLFWDNAITMFFEYGGISTIVNLQSRKIGDSGAKALAKVLKKDFLRQHTLTSINLENNNISNRGAKALAKILKKNKALKSIDLSWNNIGNDGAEDLLKVLRETDFLTSVNLDGNQIRDDLKIAIDKKITIKKTKDWIPKPFSQPMTPLWYKPLTSKESRRVTFKEKAIENTNFIASVPALPLLLTAVLGFVILYLIARFLNYWKSSNHKEKIEVLPKGFTAPEPQRSDESSHGSIVISSKAEIEASGEFKPTLAEEYLVNQPLPIVNLQVLFNIQGEAVIPQNFILSRDAYQLQQLLGSGNYGAVYAGNLKGPKGQIKVAIKRLHNQDMPQDVLDAFKREIGIMAKLSYPQSPSTCHPNIVKLHGVCLETNEYAMVMEYMPKSLDKVLHNRQECPSWKTRWQIALDIGKGLKHLHSNGVRHRDLKSENVLLDNQNQAKLCDFGLAEAKIESRSSENIKNVQQQAKQQAEVGTIRYMAPECFEGKYSKASDIYSLGILFWELAACRLPYKTFATAALIINYVEKGKREELPADKAVHTPTFFKALIKKCTAQVPEQRPTIEKVVEELEANEEDAMQFAV